MSIDREILQAQIDDLKAKIGILEEHEKVDVKDMVDMLSQIRELKLYGRSVYEAIQMLSEDYTNKSSGGVAFYNGVLSKLDKYDFVSQATTQPPKQEKWIVHRTLRTQNIEVYISSVKDFYDTKVDYLVAHNIGDTFGGYGENIFCCKSKEFAYKFNLSTALRVRDLLNKYRVGKQYLWVISKVEK